MFADILFVYLFVVILYLSLRVGLCAGMKNETFEIYIPNWYIFKSVFVI